MSRHHCIGFDLLIDTDVLIPGTLAAMPSSNWSGEARVRWRPAVAAPHVVPPIWSAEGEALRFSPAGGAHYRCAAEGVEVTPIEGASHNEVVALLVATALPAMAWLRGAFVLHATAVVPPLQKSALAVSGASGVGKSTLAKAFLDRGARLVADDSIAVAAAHDRSLCAGLAGGYHLGQDENGRMFHPLAENTAASSTPLGAIVILDGDPHRATGSRLTAIDAVAALLGNRHRPNVPRHGGFEPSSLRDAALLARTVPVYRWPRNQADALLGDEVRRTIMAGGETDE